MFNSVAQSKLQAFCKSEPIPAEIVVSVSALHDAFLADSALCVPRLPESGHQDKLAQINPAIAWLPPVSCNLGNTDPSEGDRFMHVTLSMSNHATSCG
jgi:hypothetical protein